MKLVVYDNLGNPRELHVSRVVVHDRLDNPIMLAVEVDNVILASAADVHDDFNALLDGLGIRKTVVCLSAHEKPLEHVQFQST